MENMRFKVGDRVRIKSLDWYNKNKNENGYIDCGNARFVPGMSTYCREVLTICDIEEEFSYYHMKECQYVFMDEMIECKVEEKTLIERVDDNGLPFNEWLSHKGAFRVPEDYVLKDENGNVINARKIVLEKKKKEYPKSYEECLSVLQIKGYDIVAYVPSWTAYEKTLYQQVLKLRELIICRDAYWKIAGEEMGLGKPWSPNDGPYIYCIFAYKGNIICDTPSIDCPFTFPTEEMRDAFYENFKVEIAFYKELL